MVKPAPTPLFVFRGFSGNVCSLAFETLFGKSVLLAGSSSGECTIYDLRVMKPIASLNCNVNNPGQNCSVSQCGKWSCGIWTQMRSCGIKFYVLSDDFARSPNDFFIPNDFPGFCRCVTYTNANPEFASGDEFFVVPFEQCFRIYRICENGVTNADDSLQFDKTAVGMPMCCVRVEKSEIRYLLVGFENGEIHLWNLCNYAHVSRFKLYNGEAVMCLDYRFSDNISIGLAGSVDRTVALFEIDFAKSSIFQPNDRSLSLPSNGVSSISIRDDLKVFALACWDRKVRLFSCKSLRPLAILDFHADSLQSIAFDTTVGPTGKLRLFCIASNDGSVSLWSLFDEK